MARLSNAQIEEVLERTSRIIEEHPVGLSRQSIGEAYAARFGSALTSRTLLRRLEELTRRGKITPIGAGPGTLYRPAKEGPPVLEQPEGFPPLSDEGAKVRALVVQDRYKRPPVGYDLEWLYDYEPGRTWYLPQRLRERLRELGTTADGDRPAGTFARDILGRLLIDLSWASSRLEGNTYTRLDTQNLIEFGQRAEGKDAREAQMILNHKTAIEYLVAGGELVGFDRQTLLSVHAALSENLLDDPSDEGRLRERAVGITGTTFTPMANPQVIRESFERIVETGSRIPDPFEQAFFAMVHIPYLQPFMDVNKRTSRLAANIPLIAANLCPLSFVDVPERAYAEGILGVYEQKRVELLRDVFAFAYERSAAQYRVVRDSLGQPDPIRLRYRAQLEQLVADTLRGREAPRREAVRARGVALGVPDRDLDAFAETGLKVLVGLHEGSVGRYGLRPSEFFAWRELYRPA